MRAYTTHTLRHTGASAVWHKTQSLPDWRLLTLVVIRARALAFADILALFLATLGPVLHA